MSEAINKKAFYISTGVHVCFFVILALFAFTQLIPKEPEPFVFEVVDTADNQILPAINPTEPVEVSRIDAPDIPEFKYEEPPPIVRPERVTRPPEPEPEPVKETPPPVRPKPVEAKKPKVVKTTAADFFNKNPKRQTPQQAQPPTTARKVDVPKINAPKLNDIKLSSPTSNNFTNSAQLQAAISSYGARLRANAEVAWSRPHLSNAKSLEVIIIFTIAADGKILNVRIAKSSGNSILDKSALAGARKTRSAGPLPVSETTEFRVPYQVK